MKKFVALPLAALFFAACSEPTTPGATADLSPRYAKPGSGAVAGEICGSGTLPSCDVNASYNFESGLAASGTGTTLGTEPEPFTFSAVDAPTVITAPEGQNFIGRFANVDTYVAIGLEAGHSLYSLKFDLYTIGSWDGKGRQAQHGVFLANVFSVSYRCSGSTDVFSLLETTFSNQLTVQQDYPLDISAGGGSKAATGSYNTDLLGYKDEDPPTSNTPTFRSFGDVEYTLSFSGANPCGTLGITFLLGTSNPNQQSVTDESWGIDNIFVKAT